MNRGLLSTIRRRGVAATLAIVASLSGTVLGVTPSLAAAEPAAEPQPLIVKLAGPEGVPSDVPNGVPLPVPYGDLGPGTPLVITRPDGTWGCTANFIWRSGGTKYLGTAGHCLFPTPSRIQACVSGCVFGVTSGAVLSPLVDVCNLNCSFPVIANGGVGNDFGLIGLANSTSTLRYTVPVFGGPVGSIALTAGQPVCYYGNGLGVGEVFATKARVAIGAGATANAWYADGAASLGDSGAPVVKCDPHTSDAIRGSAAIGIETHGPCASVIPARTMCGTTVARAIGLAASSGLSISIAEGS
ncbi:MAG TPA: hypothetical protein VI916_04745 [Acidimicrobiia bacterium]|nr:hypothetical protein [Acidimicrobiia bacterium]